LVSLGIQEIPDKINITSHTTVNNFTWDNENYTAASGSKVTLNYPVSVAVDASANIYVVDSKGYLWVGSSGVYTNWPTTAAGSAVAVSAGLDGSVWITEKVTPKKKKDPTNVLSLYCYMSSTFVQTSIPAVLVNALYSI